MDKQKSCAFVDVKADPLASAEEISGLSAQDPLAAIAHPNCPLELWWGLAARHPIEAQESVLFSLLTLESPERWTQLEEHRIHYGINSAEKKLLRVQRHLFAADCAERVLHFLEAQDGSNKVPRNAIKEIRLYAQGESTEKKMFVMGDFARSSVQETIREFSQAPSVHRARRLALAGGIGCAVNSIWAATRDIRETSVPGGPAVRIDSGVVEAARSSAEAVGYFVRADSQGSLDEAKALGEAAKKAERRWQWGRLQEYLRACNFHDKSEHTF